MITTTIDRRTVRVFCETCSKAYAQFYRHEQGQGHRNRRRIIALLDQQCLTLREISQRLGVSFQRVHQIARELGYDTRGRQRACTISRRDTRTQCIPETHPKLMVRLEALRASGYDFRLTHGQLRSPTNRRVVINGTLATIHSSRANPAQAPRSGRKYIRVQVTDRSAALTIIYCEFDDSVYVVPTDWLPIEAWLPKGGEIIRSTKATRDWEQWRDRWDLFENRREV